MRSMWPWIVCQLHGRLGVHAVFSRLVRHHDWADFPLGCLLDLSGRLFLCGAWLHCVHAVRCRDVLEQRRCDDVPWVSQRLRGDGCGCDDLPSVPTWDTVDRSQCHLLELPSRDLV